MSHLREAVITQGTRGEEWVVGSYGGAMRPVEFTVCACTGHRGTQSTTKLVTIEGFARDAKRCTRKSRSGKQASRGNRFHAIVAAADDKNGHPKEPCIPAFAPTCGHKG